MSLGVNRIDRFLKLMNDRGASDLHLSVGRPPMLRVSGELAPVRYRVLSNRDFVQLMKPIASETKWEDFLERGDVDFAYAVEGLARFRVNMLMQQRGYGAVFRIIPDEILSLTQLGLPRSVEKIARMRSGLVLVTGPTGSGKSTTLAAIIDRINEQHARHILTIEDPIEFVHPVKRSMIGQRQVHVHARGFGEAVRAAVREDPDAILVGEMRDLETIRAALKAAEAGFLVFGTLHTNSAGRAIDRIINVFPPDEQDAVRGSLAGSLQAVVAQQLLKKIGGGRVAALEVLFAGTGLASLIREGKAAQITSFIQMGRSAGMVAMDESLIKLYLGGVVDAEAVYEKAIDKRDMKKRLAAAGVELEDTEDE